MCRSSDDHSDYSIGQTHTMRIMERPTKIALLALLLCLSGPLSAESSLDNHESAIPAKSPTSHNAANKGAVMAKASGTRVTVIHDRQKRNSAVISQSGPDNRTTLNQGGSNSSLEVDQKGQGNRAVVRQSPTGNTVVISQN